MAPFTVTMQTGVRFTNANLDSFRESGSELALDVGGINKTSSSVLADLGFGLDPQQLYSWTITPCLTLGYERVLDNPRVESTGTLFGFSVSQFSAFDAHDLVKAGLGISARHDAFMLKAAVNGVVGDGAGAAGIGGQVSLSYGF